MSHHDSLFVEVLKSRIHIASYMYMLYWFCVQSVFWTWRERQRVWTLTRWKLRGRTVMPRPSWRSCPTTSNKRSWSYRGEERGHLKSLYLSYLMSECWNSETIESDNNNLIAYTADTESCYFEYERIFLREVDDFQVFKIMFSESWENRRHWRKWISTNWRTLTQEQRWCRKNWMDQSKTNSLINLYNQCSTFRSLVKRL